MSDFYPNSEELCKKSERESNPERCYREAAAKYSESTQEQLLLEQVLFDTEFCAISLKQRLVDARGFEPLAPCLQRRRHLDAPAPTSVKPSRVAIRAARFARSRLLIQHGGRDFQNEGN